VFGPSYDHTKSLLIYIKLHCTSYAFFALLCCATGLRVLDLVFAQTCSGCVSVPSQANAADNAPRDPRRHDSKLLASFLGSLRGQQQLPNAADRAVPPAAKPRKLLKRLLPWLAERQAETAAAVANSPSGGAASSSGQRSAPHGARKAHAEKAAKPLDRQVSTIRAR
jgi:hypothetical protein